MHKKPVAAAKTMHEMLRFSCFEKRGFTFHERVLVSMIMILSYSIPLEMKRKIKLLCVFFFRLFFVIQVIFNHLSWGC